jgi:type I restriction enzyme S subunit
MAAASVRTFRFDQMATLINDRVDNPTESGVERYVGLEHLDADSLRIRRWGEITDVESTKLRFQPGDIIFGKRRVYQRKLAVADFEGICSAHAMVLRAKETVVLPQFLPFFMQSDRFMERALAISVGSLSPTINWTTLAAEEFALPPIEEQRRILEILQAAEQNKESLENVLHCSQSVLDSFLENELDPKRRGWRQALLGDLFEVKSGGTPSRGEKKYWGGSIPWVKTAEVRYETIQATEEAITEAGLNNSSAKLLPVGTVIVALFGQGPTLGRVGMLGIQAATNQACACIVPNDSQNSRFLYFYLQRQYGRMRALARGANQPNLNLAIIKNLEVPVLGEEEQREWVSQLETIGSAVSMVRQRLQVPRNLSGQILQSALRDKQ